MSNDTLNLDWQTLHADCRTLAARLLEQQRQGQRRWNGIVGIARGGLIPAAILAREMDIRLVDTLCISSYEHDKQGELNVLKSLDHSGRGLLIIDDLVDSGKTAAAARDLLPEANIAVIYAKPAAIELVDEFVQAIDQQTWIHFPWDLDQQQQFIHPLSDLQNQIRPPDTKDPLF